MNQTILQMKGLTTRLSAAKNLLGPICQEDVRTLRSDLVKVRPMVIGFSCMRLQALFDEVDSQAADIFSSLTSNSWRPSNLLSSFQM